MNAQWEEAMPKPCPTLVDRRRLLMGLAALPVAFSAVPYALAATGNAIVPPVGLGTWITFNVGNDPVGIAQSEAVVRAFFEAGGRLIDSSPMYGSSQATVGRVLRNIGPTPDLFAADKIWTPGFAAAKAQLEETRKAWGVERFSLLQVHNLTDWEEHLPWLRDMKAAGELGYVGVTTSHGRRHGDLERILKTEAIDFVQMTYNAATRDVEARLLPLARERGVAVIVNRPYEGGRLIRQLKRDPLPGWAGEAGLTTWADVALGFILSHPAVTCAIPATTRVDHVQENMAAGRWTALDEMLRRRIAAYVDDL
ncbi:aldo/keto reductase [Gimibacter soli]|uniref:Aldo/keto reductase n=1 Tax=Gimibacter soli TaxID=3024400 RepID=A0AAE9XSZ6_9PROT|nr:aldo/keto reductase [Gimibacter soli]WCL52638.1 aldo/keto reductase [Gimibacter soli]